MAFLLLIALPAVVDPARILPESLGRTASLYWLRVSPSLRSHRCAVPGGRRGSPRPCATQWLDGRGCGGAERGDSAGDRDESGILPGRGEPFRYAPASQGQLTPEGWTGEARERALAQPMLAT